MKLAALVAFVPALPLFRSTAGLTVTRPGTTTYVDGVAQATPGTPTPIVGSVDPSQSETLNRMLEGQNISGAIMVVTSTPLSAGTASRAADVIGWNGRTYAVKAVSDFAEGGIGIRQAACTLIPVNPAT